MKWNDDKPTDLANELISTDGKSRMKCVSDCSVVTDAHCTFIRHLLRSVHVCVLCVCVRWSACAHSNHIEYMQRWICTTARIHRNERFTHERSLLRYVHGQRVQYAAWHWCVSACRLWGILYTRTLCAYMRSNIFRMVACATDICTSFLVVLYVSSIRRYYLQHEIGSPLHTTNEIHRHLPFTCFLGDE